MTDTAETGKQLGDLAINNAGSDLLTGFLGLVSASVDNPLLGVSLGLIIVLGVQSWRNSKPNSAMADVAKDSTATTQKTTFRQSDTLDKVIDNFAGLSSQVVDLQARTVVILEAVIQTNEKISHEISMIRTIQEEHGVMIRELRCRRAGDFKESDNNGKTS